MKKKTLVICGITLAIIAVVIGGIYISSSKTAASTASTDLFEENVYYIQDTLSEEQSSPESQDYAPAEVITVTEAPSEIAHSFELSSESVTTEIKDAPVDETTYSEAKEYSTDILDLQNRISAAMGPGNELSFVTTSMILENPDRLHVVVNTSDTAAIELLKSYNTSGVNLEIEYSTDVAVEE